MEGEGEEREEEKKRKESFCPGALQLKRASFFLAGPPSLESFRWTFYGILPILAPRSFYDWLGHATMATNMYI